MSLEQTIHELQARLPPDAELMLRITHRGFWVEGRWDPGRCPDTVAGLPVERVAQLAESLEIVCEESRLLVVEVNRVLTLARASPAAAAINLTYARK